MKKRVVPRFAAYLWASPNTMLGGVVGLVMMCLGGQVRFVRGTAEFHCGLVSRFLACFPAVFRFRAMTLGHVVLGISEVDLCEAREHEHVHVRQYERWGVFFLPAYGLSSLWQLLRGRRAYRDNFFEKSAYAVVDTTGN